MSYISIRWKKRSLSITRIIIIISFGECTDRLVMDVKDIQRETRPQIKSNEEQEDEMRKGDEHLQRETRDEVRMVDEERRQEQETEETRRKMEREKQSWQAEVVERANDSLVNAVIVLVALCAQFSS